MTGDGREVRRISTGLMANILVTLLVSSLFATGAAAQSEMDADFETYCRTKYPNSSPQRIGLTHYCQQAGSTQGATRHNINLAEACSMTTGNESFRRWGSRVICAGETDVGPDSDATTAVGLPDYQAYCRERFPNSSYERRAENWGIVHYCRRPGATGGFTLQQIDLAEACALTRGADGYETTNSGVVCTSGEGSDVAELPPSPSPGPEAFPQPFPGPLPLPGPAPVRDGQGSPGRTDPSQNMSLACQALGGQWRGDTIPLVEEILAQMQGATAARTSNCINAAGWVEQCRVGVRAEQAIAGYFQVLMIWQCHVAVVREPDAWELEDISTAREEACVIQETLSDLQEKINQEVGTMPSAPHDAILETAKIDDLCCVPCEWILAPAEGVPDLAGMARAAKSASETAAQRARAQAIAEAEREIRADREEAFNQASMFIDWVLEGER